ncbi:MAG: hypothetical protein JO287_18315 [Pseudonocardiales bacterium]|nr:hypothetical protein [Pseudonocardiales bacterium]
MLGTPLCQQYDDTHNEQVAIFKHRFDRAADALINLTIDELYPPEDEDLDATEDSGGPEEGHNAG